MLTAFIGPTNIILDGLNLSRYDEYVKAWKWSCYITGNFHYWPKYSNRIVYGRRNDA